MLKEKRIFYILDFFLFHPEDYYKLSLYVTFNNISENLWKLEEYMCIYVYEYMINVYALCF